MRYLVRGRPGDPAWVRAALIALLSSTAILFMWGLSASGYANAFYSAAVQAGSESWKAFFFGSSDAGNSITVDKTPLFLWPMDLSVRFFGLSSWSILAPQAIEGVLTVGVLYAAVRRATASAAAGLIAGTTLALTPIAVLMFRFNNPDSMLVLLLTCAAAATLRAVEASGMPDSPAGSSGRRAGRWLALAGALVGLAFLAKMLQAFLVLPALVLVYFLFSKTSVGRRIGHLVAAFTTMVAAGGWWVLIVSLWPASSRPYIGGSQNNSVLELALGYNGFGRLTGNETGSIGGGGGGAGGGWGATGITRLFDAEIGGQITWLLPAALVLGVATLWLARHDRLVRAATWLWLGWLVTTGLIFSFMAGIFHAYYTVALAPALAALIGIGSVQVWKARGQIAARAVLAGAVVLTGVWAFVLLGRSADFATWLRPLVLGGGIAVAVVVLVADRLGRRAVIALAAAGLVVGLAGPAAYAVQTASTGHSGSIPTAGPSTGAGMGGPGGRPGGFGRGPGGAFGGGMGAPGGGGNQAGMQGQLPPGNATGNATGAPGAGAGGAMGGGMGGGLLDATTPSSAILAKLTSNASSYRWVAATVGANNAAGYQLASGLSVMPIGGFNGSDPSPTLAQFEAWVDSGRIHWFIASGSGQGGGMSPGGTGASAITQWVEKNFTATTVDGVTMYDLSGGAQ